MCPAVNPTGVRGCLTSGDPQEAPKLIVATFTSLIGMATVLATSSGSTPIETTESAFSLTSTLGIRDGTSRRFLLLTCSATPGMALAFMIVRGYALHYSLLICYTNTFH